MSYAHIVDAKIDDMISKLESDAEKRYSSVLRCLTSDDRAAVETYIAIKSSQAKRQGRREGEYNSTVAQIISSLVGVALIAALIGGLGMGCAAIAQNETSNQIAREAQMEAKFETCAPIVAKHLLKEPK